MKDTNERHMIDPRLYLIIDSTTTPDCVKQAVMGGVTLVQLRDKQSTTRSRITHARMLVEHLGALKVPLFINDRVDVALACNAAGVHLGQEDMSVEDARRILPAATQIGLTVRTVDEARQAPVELLDYISIGGVYPTHSKHNTTPPLGTQGLKEITGLLRERGARCLTAIAGINADNVGDVMGCGVDGVAIISAITLADSPTQAAQTLRNAIDVSSTTL